MRNDNSYSARFQAALNEIEDSASSAEAIDRVIPSRFSKEDVKAPISVGVVAGIAGGIVGGLSAYIREDNHPVAALGGALLGSAVGYATGNLLSPLEYFGASGKILSGTAGFFNGAGIAIGTADLINGLMGNATVSEADL